MGDALPGSVPHWRDAADQGAKKIDLAAVVRRTLDVMVAVTALVVTGPMILLAMVAIKCTSRGPVLYRANLRWAERSTVQDAQAAHHASWNR